MTERPSTPKVCYRFVPVPEVRKRAIRRELLGLLARLLRFKAPTRQDAQASAPPHP